jgi:signal transduction histidine kinase
MSTLTILDELLELELFSELQRDSCACFDFLDDGVEIALAEGERLVHEGQTPAFFIVLEGDLHVIKEDEDGTEMVLATHHRGSYFGEVPLLLGTEFFASGQAVGATRVLRIEEAAFWQLLSLCPSITRKVMRTMAQRVQNLESISQGREKLLSLGTMAASLAHELNNPAAAAVRAAQEMRSISAELSRAACRLHKQKLDGPVLDHLAQLQHDLAARDGKLAREVASLSSMERSDRESAIEDWLEERGVPNGWELAPTLVEAGLSDAWLGELSQHVPNDALEVTLNWIIKSLSIEQLAGEVEDATTRISGLVKQVKVYSHMDQAPLQSVDLHAALDSTLALLGHEFRSRHIEITRQYDPSLPTVNAYGAELNQVWTNLLSNAADALEDAPEGKRCITVRTQLENTFALVQIEDSGPGVPPELMARIFDPFFTTKSVGRGTGLGLGISHRIIEARHRGQISVNSQPGHTVFTIRLPLDLSSVAA